MSLRITQEKLMQSGVTAVGARLLEQLFDVVPDVAFFIKDAEGRYQNVNESIVRRHGLSSKSQVIGKRPCDICPGEFGRIPTMQDEAVIQTGRALMEHLELQLASPGDPVWCLTTKLPILGESGSITGIVGFSRDVRTKVEPEEIPDGFASALSEFENELSDEVTPTWLAQRSELSPQRLTRLTKRLFDLTPGQLIARTRISAACQMLRETDDSIIKVSVSCGYTNHSAFTRAFRSATGIAPSVFRNQFRSHP